MSRQKKSSSAENLAKKIREFVAKQENNTYNYKQVSAAIGASTPVQQRNVALELIEMAFN